MVLQNKCQPIIVTSYDHTINGNPKMAECTQKWMDVTEPSGKVAASIENPIKAE